MFRYRAVKSGLFQESSFLQMSNAGLSVSSDCEGSPPRRLGAAPQTLPMLSTALPSSSCNQLLFKILPAFLQLFGEGRGGVAMVVWRDYKIPD